eukprot:1185088-Prorocentrum_minimum.AAC.2
MSGVAFNDNTLVSVDASAFEDRLLLAEVFAEPTENERDDSGGALSLSAGTSVTMRNCTFDRNESPTGSGAVQVLSPAH